MSNQPELSEDEVRQLLAEAVHKAGGQEQWAATAGVSQAYVSNVLAGKIHPGGAITRALGYKRVHKYVLDAWDDPDVDIWKGSKT